jgi:hypothetical protein
LTNSTSARNEKQQKRILRKQIFDTTNLDIFFSNFVMAITFGTAGYERNNNSTVCICFEFCRNMAQYSSIPLFTGSRPNRAELDKECEYLKQEQVFI